MRYAFAGKAVFDLAHLAELSDVPSLLLTVSERTFYLLQNLAVTEVINPRRYAVAFADQEYTPVTESDGEYEDFKAIRDNAQLELVEVDLSSIYGIDHADLSGHQLLSQPAGNYDLEIDPVPEGEVWEVQALQLYTNQDYQKAMFQIVDGAGEIVLASESTPGQWEFFTWQGRVTISEGQYPRVRVKQIDADADMIFYVWYIVLA